MKIIIDCNVWVSYALGKGLATLPRIVKNPRIKVFHSQHLIDELADVLQRPAIKRKISKARYFEIFELIRRFSNAVELKEIKKFQGDPKDSYLLALSKKTGAKFLLTNDQLLQNLIRVNGTKIISYKHFVEIIRLEITN